jgi:hypothetical protein
MFPESIRNSKSFAHLHPITNISHLLHFARSMTRT